MMLPLYYLYLEANEEVRKRMAQIKNRFKVLLAQKELRDGRKYTYESIQQQTGVSPTTLSNYARGTVTRFDEPTLVALCNFLDCELAELIEYPPDLSQQDMASPEMATAIG